MGLFQKSDPSTKAEKKRQAAWELGKKVDPRQIAYLQGYLEDGSAEVRRAAISSLEQQWPTGDAVGIRILTEKLRDSDSQVRATAALALGEFIPRAMTLGAKQMGDKAIQELLNILITEEDESVLSNVFMALGNIDDPGILPRFTAVLGKLKKDVLYLGSRKIDLLRPSVARSKMISQLQKATESQSSSQEKSDDLGTYHDRLIRKSNIEFLTALEKQAGSPIPVVTSVVWNTRGALVESNQVVELGLYNMSLAALPDNIGQLTGLRALWVTNNKLQALPVDFGKLISLKKLLIYQNEITALPDSIVRLEKLEFLRLDRKATTHISEDVAKWLKKQESRLGSAGLLWD